MQDGPILYGVGTGPGDPDLMTVKAIKAIANSDVVAHFAKLGRTGNARTIADSWMNTNVEEVPLYYPVTTELNHRSDEYRTAIQDFFDTSAETIRAQLKAGRTVSVLSEGDPMFYGSYMHLHIRLANDFNTIVIPGITAMSGCWSQAGLPLVQGEDAMTVLPGTMDEETLVQRLSGSEAAIIMKVGSNLPKIRRALRSAGKLDGAIYVERGTMENGFHQPLSEKEDDKAPYFSLLLVPGWSSKPGGSIKLTGSVQLGGSDKP